MKVFSLTLPILRINFGELGKRFSKSRGLRRPCQYYDLCYDICRQKFSAQTTEFLEKVFAAVACSLLYESCAIGLQKQLKTGSGAWLRNVAACSSFAIEFFVMAPPVCCEELSLDTSISFYIRHRLHV